MGPESGKEGRKGEQAGNNGKEEENDLEFEYERGHDSGLDDGRDQTHSVDGQLATPPSKRRAEGWLGTFRNLNSRPSSSSSNKSIFRMRKKKEKREKKKENGRKKSNCEKVELSPHFREGFLLALARPTRLPAASATRSSVRRTERKVHLFGLGSSFTGIQRGLSQPTYSSFELRCFSPVCFSERILSLSSPNVLYNNNNNAASELMKSLGFGRRTNGQNSTYE